MSFEGTQRVQFRAPRGLIERADALATVFGDVLGGNLSKRKAAEQLDTTRTTIRASLNDRPELYELA